MADARETAVRALLSVDRGAWSDLTLSASIKKAGLDTRDAAFCTALCTGVLQNRALLDHYILSYSSLRLNKIAPYVLNVLRVGIYQIVFMDRVPHSAAVNTAVTMIRRSQNPRAAGFANAVLRRVSENAESLPKPDARDRVSYLSTLYSHPKWLVKYYLKTLGEDAEAVLAANNGVPPMTARVNRLKGNVIDAIALLEQDGVRTKPHPYLPDALILLGSGSVESLRAFQSGLITIQDAASQLDVLALSPQPGERILDMCAAPGGKTFAMAALMNNRGAITACDIYEHRLGLIRSGAERLGVSIAETALSDGTVFRPEWEGQFDRVLVDAPCSGMGIIRRKAEIRYKDPAEIAKLPAVQKTIFSNAVRYLKDGGTMVYSTCSVMQAENEDVVRDRLAAHPELKAVEFSLPGGISSHDGMLTLWPGRHGTDGFFISKLTKRNL